MYSEIHVAQGHNTMIVKLATKFATITQFIHLMIFLIILGNKCLM